VVGAAGAQYWLGGGGGRDDELEPLGVVVEGAPVLGDGAASRGGAPVIGGWVPGGPVVEGDPATPKATCAPTTAPISAKTRTSELSRTAGDWITPRHDGNATSR
jgi:hypothetical protein